MYVYQKAHLPTSTLYMYKRRTALKKKKKKGTVFSF